MFIAIKYLFIPKFIDRLLNKINSVKFNSITIIEN